MKEKDRKRLREWEGKQRGDRDRSPLKPISTTWTHISMGWNIRPCPNYKIADTITIDVYVKDYLDIMERREELAPKCGLCDAPYDFRWTN